MLNKVEQLAAQFKALVDPVRMRLVALCQQGECSVSELTQVVALSQPRVSQHLKQLCDAAILERFRDGQWVFYRVPVRGGDAVTRSRLLDLIPDDDVIFQNDLARLQELRGERVASSRAEVNTERLGDRALHKALLELTITTQVGDLLDIGCGRGRILKLLANRAHRAVGVDVDFDARRLARAELMLAGLPNCSLRRGNMYRLPFEDAEFDTIILDDVLAEAKYPVRVLNEAGRLLRLGGRIFVFLYIKKRSPIELQSQLAKWSAVAGLRLAPAKIAPKNDSQWLLSVATSLDHQSSVV